MAGFRFAKESSIALLKEKLKCMLFILLSERHWITLQMHKDINLILLTDCCWKVINYKSAFVSVLNRTQAL